MDSELVRALRADLRRCLDDVATEFRARGRDDTRFVQLIARMDALAAHDARESSLPGSTDIARGNDGPNVPDRDAIAWLVIDDERRPHYASSFPEACHDHINEALMHEDDDAKAWHVIPVYRMPAAQRAESELAALKDENARLLAANKDCILHYEDCRSELAALRKRIAEAPTHVAEWTLAYGLTFNDADGTLDGHRVALLDVGKEG